MFRAKQITRYIYGAFWVAAALNHFFNMPFYVSIMPPYLRGLWRYSVERVALLGGE
jgi:hypothetical protein